MHPDEVAFRAALACEPADDTTRFVYADWLDEHDRPSHAAYLRSIRRAKFVRRVRQWLDGNDPFTGERPSLGAPGFLEPFTDYNRDYPSWGVLHVVLDDGNVDDGSVLFCMEYRPPIWATISEAEQDRGNALAVIVLQLSRTQRLKLPELVRARLAAESRRR